jgi:putative membrane protein
VPDRPGLVGGNWTRGRFGGDTGRMIRFLVRLVLTALALWLATAIVGGIHLYGDSVLERFFSLVLVALVFTLVNTFVKPLVMAVGCALYVLTLGLFGLVVNALMFWLTGWISEKLSLGFFVDGFWAAFWGAIIVSLAMWVMDLLSPRTRTAEE